MYVVNGLPLVLSRNLTTRYEDDHGRSKDHPLPERRGMHSMNRDGRGGGLFR